MESYIPVEMEMSTSVKKDHNISNEVGAPAIVVPSESSMHQILRNATVQLMAVYILVYVGVEVTIGGESREARYEHD
jgi:fucose permease